MEKIKEVLHMGGHAKHTDAHDQGLGKSDGLDVARQEGHEAYDSGAPVYAGRSGTGGVASTGTTNQDDSFKAAAGMSTDTPAGGAYTGSQHLGQQKDTPGYGQSDVYGSQTQGTTGSSSVGEPGTHHFGVMGSGTRRNDNIEDGTGHRTGAEASRHSGNTGSNTDTFVNDPTSASGYSGSSSTRRPDEEFGSMTRDDPVSAGQGSSHLGRDVGATGAAGLATSELTDRSTTGTTGLSSGTGMGHGPHTTFTGALLDPAGNENINTFHDEQLHGQRGLQGSGATIDPSRGPDFLGRDPAFAEGSIAVTGTTGTGHHGHHHGHHHEGAGIAGATGAGLGAGSALGSEQYGSSSGMGSGMGSDQYGSSTGPASSTSGMTGTGGGVGSSSVGTDYSSSNRTGAGLGRTGHGLSGDVSGRDPYETTSAMGSGSNTQGSHLGRDAALGGGAGLAGAAAYNDYENHKSSATQRYDDGNTVGSNYGQSTGQTSGLGSSGSHLGQTSDQTGALDSKHFHGGHVTSRAGEARDPHTGAHGTLASEGLTSHEIKEHEKHQRERETGHEKHGILGGVFSSRDKDHSNVPGEVAAGGALATGAGYEESKHGHHGTGASTQGYQSTPAGGNYGSSTSRQTDPYSSSSTAGTSSGFGSDLPQRDHHLYGDGAHTGGRNQTSSTGTSGLTSGNNTSSSVGEPGTHHFGVMGSGTRRNDNLDDGTGSGNNKGNSFFRKHGPQTGHDQHTSSKTTSSGYGQTGTTGYGQDTSSGYGQTGSTGYGQNTPGAFEQSTSSSRNPLTSSSESYDPTSANYGSSSAIPSTDGYASRTGGFSSADQTTGLEGTSTSRAAGQGESSLADYGASSAGPSYGMTGADDLKATEPQRSGISKLLHREHPTKLHKEPKDGAYPST